MRLRKKNCCNLCVIVEDLTSVSAFEAIALEGTDEINELCQICLVRQN